MILSKLNYDQKCHLAWRLDHKTAMGLLTACRIARGVLGDLELTYIFRRAGKTMHSAKIHARKVINYKRPESARGERSKHFVSGV